MKNKLFLITIFILLGTVLTGSSHTITELSKEKYSEIIQKQKQKEWDSLVKAIAFVESSFDSKAYNKKSGALGILQIKKIYVDEVNRILKLRKSKKRYKYSDRLNIQKSKEMFEIYQSHHNPKRNINKAIKIHRGLNSPSYTLAVKTKMKEYQK